MTIDLPLPLPRSQCGFPLGNGNFGALVWGTCDIHITVNRSDFWDHRDGEEILGENIYQRAVALQDPMDPKRLDAAFIHRPWPGDGAFLNTRLPAGRFDLKLCSGLQPKRGSLDLLQGELTILLQASDDTTRALVISVHPRRNVLMIQDPTGAVEEIVPRPAWDWMHRQLLSRDYSPPLRVSDPSIQGWVQECPDDPALASLARRSGAMIAIALSLGETGEKAQEHSLAELQQCREQGSGIFQEEIRIWWADYWREIPRVKIPDGFFNDYLNFALFKFAAATNPASPVPAGLQGPWCEESQIPPWSGDYHFNVNIQQIYTLAFPAGKADHLLPLFDMLERCRDIFSRQARAMVGIDDGLLIALGIDDRGQCCGGIGPSSALDQAVGGWAAQLYWLYYQYTGDREFLRVRAMPFMSGVMRVYEEMLDWTTGVPRLPIGISAEYAHVLPDGQRQRVGSNPSYQLACIHMLAGALIEGSRILGQEVRPIWARIREWLPSWSLIGESENCRIAIWEDQDLEVSHRHHAHLASIYPFDCVPDETPQTAKILKNSLHHWLGIGMSDWSEWCLPWAAIIQARSGYREGPWLLLKLCREIFINEGLATVYIPRFPGFTNHRIEWLGTRNEIMQLDGTMALATALYEMLVHTHGGVVRFFPAIPEAWRDVSFEGIRLPGPLLVGGSKKDGSPQGISITSSAGGPVRIDVPDRKCLRLHRSGTSSVVTLPLAIELKPGERIEGSFESLE